MLRVGTVSGQPKSTTFWLAFEQHMAELGYEEGRNFAFDHRSAPIETGMNIERRRITANTM